MGASYVSPSVPLLVGGWALALLFGERRDCVEAALAVGLQVFCKC